MKLSVASCKARTSTRRSATVSTIWLGSAKPSLTLSVMIRAHWSSVLASLLALMPSLSWGSLESAVAMSAMISRVPGESSVSAWPRYGMIAIPWAIMHRARTTSATPRREKIAIAAVMIMSTMNHGDSALMVGMSGSVSHEYGVHHVAVPSMQMAHRNPKNNLIPKCLDCMFSLFLPVHSSSRSMSGKSVCDNHLGALRRLPVIGMSSLMPFDGSMIFHRRAPLDELPIRRAVAGSRWA